MGPEAAVAGWRGSEGHRRNLLGPFDACGIGWAASDSGTIFVTQLLALLDKRSHQQGQIREKISDVACSCSTPAICFGVGLVIGGPWVAAGGAVAGRALDVRCGFKAASVPRVLKDRARGLIRRRGMCSRCGDQSETELLIDESQGTLLCNSCHPAP